MLYKYTINNDKIYHYTICNNIIYDNIKYNKYNI